VPSTCTHRRSLSPLRVSTRTFHRNIKVQVALAILTQQTCLSFSARTFHSNSINRRRTSRKAQRLAQRQRQSHHAPPSIFHQAPVFKLRPSNCQTLDTIPSFSPSTDTRSRILTPRSVHLPTKLLSLRVGSISSHSRDIMLRVKIANIV
jgi:hypothetical protein